MSEEITAALVGALSAVIVSYIGFRVQKWKFEKDFEHDRERIRTEFMAERVARQLLDSKTFRRRTFKMIQKRLGGFDDDELRKILVRAGAVRFVGGRTGKEFWGLVERNDDALLTRKERLELENAEANEEDEEADEPGVPAV